jgi:hypothetical protein
MEPDRRCGIALLSQQREIPMPAKSKKQQMAAGAALSAKRGLSAKASLRGASRQMARSMTERQLEDFAHTKRTRLPTTTRARSKAKSKAGTKAGSKTRARRSR